MKQACAAFALAIATTAVLPAAGFCGPAPEPMQDVDYVLIDPQPALRGKVEVIEFFYYGCESCDRLEPRLQSWLRVLPSDVSFRRIPAIRRTAWVALTRLYFALEQLGEIDRLHERVYRAVHEGGLNLGDSRQRGDWARQVGIDSGKLDQMLDSDAVQAQVQRAHDATVAYGVRATPSFIVDGRYMTSGSMVGSLEALLPVVDALVEKARAGKPGR